MITRQQIDQLLAFKNGRFLITSCYLNLDRSKMPVQMLKIRIKDLLQSARHELQAKAGSHEQRESLREDFEQIEKYVMAEISNGQHKALAMFSCAGEKFWQAFGLPRMVRNILIADRESYLRPLVAILEEQHRYCVVLVDRVHAQIFEAYMGQIQARTELLGEVPRRVREGGFGGREERNFERRHDAEVRQHFEQVAGETFSLFKQQGFDRLILGGHRDVLSEFKQHLHPYLRQRWAGDFLAEPGKTTLPEVLANARAVEERLDWEKELKLADELVRKAEAGQLAVSGMDATLNALARGEAQMMLVEDGFEQPGYICRQCHYVSTEQRTCPACLQVTEPCADVVDEAVALAMTKNCRVAHVQSATALRNAGRIGALLRYQTA
jgi:peptide subunit release factor 1 (eRF1)